MSVDRSRKWTEGEGAFREVMVIISYFQINLFPMLSNRLTAVFKGMRYISFAINTHIIHLQINP